MRHAQKWQYVIVSAALLATGVASHLTLAQGLAPYALSTASFLGDSSSADCVRGARIQSNGMIVLAANMTSTPTGVRLTLLNGATASSADAVMRLSPAGSR